MKKKALGLLLALLAISCGQSAHSMAQVDKAPAVYDTLLHAIPLGGNAYFSRKLNGGKEKITKDGLRYWDNPQSITSVYFRSEQGGRLLLKLRARTAKAGDSSRIKVSIDGVSKAVNLSGKDFTIDRVGYFDVQPGYVRVDLQGLKKSGSSFGEISQLLIGGPASAGDLIYSKDPDMYYWARRGPSCHLQYKIPTADSIQYYYGELMVPEGRDPVGSYFMSNGFNGGYFGIQVNSATERRILFSVWSPYKTDNPKDIPDDMQVKLNKKGENVKTGEFGNEGSGGQSYLQYDWKTGVTYKFLLKGQPDKKGATDFSAWVYLVDRGGWFLIASWKQPKTSTSLKGFYSFVENFAPENGYQGRSAYFFNRWVRTSAGKWLAIDAANFSVDATYKAKERIDAMGGRENNQFYLKNGGFFNTIVRPGALFTIDAPNEAPDIDFSQL